MSIGWMLVHHSHTFLLQTAAKVTVKKADETRFHQKIQPRALLHHLHLSYCHPRAQGSALRQGSPGTPNQRPMSSIHVETEDQHRSQLAEWEQKDRLKVEAAEREKKEKAKGETKRKAKLAEEIHK